MLPQNFIPSKPFPEFKWKWACLQCTEGLNDPVVLLGVLSRMYKLEPYGYKYSSPEFSNELIDLSNDVSDSVGVDLARRTGSRNLIRNSGQYWKALGLINSTDHSGKINLTPFGRKVAVNDISQAEFAAITVQTFKLPNIQIQTSSECQKWINHKLILYPLRLLLEIVVKLYELAPRQAYVSPEELTKIIIPLSGSQADLQDYVNFIIWYRAGDISLLGWPDCLPGANDFRIAREYLLFLSNYGYLDCTQNSNRLHEQYAVNTVILDEIREIIKGKPKDDSLQQSLDIIRSTEVAAEIDRKRVANFAQFRPNQAIFRKEVLKACGRCVISNVTMPEILEAAHIKPFKYNGEDTVANGFAMRVDIHTLFDAGHLRISPDGDIELSSKARMDYGASIPPRIVIPAFTNREFLRWRWENYHGM